MAVKNTPSTLPHCHPIPIEGCDVKWENTPSGLKCLVTVKTTAKTGVEMEALTATNLAALTIYDMCKAVDKNMSITNLRLVSKTKS